MEALIRVFSSVLAMSLSAVPVIGVLFLLRLLLRRAPRGYSYALWAAAAFRLVCPASLPSPWSLFNLAGLIGSQTGPSLGGEAVISPAPAAQGTAPVAVQGTLPAAQFGVNWMSGAAILWAAGVVLVLLWTLCSLYHLRRQISAAIRVEGDVWTSDAIPGPFVLGLLRPRIYIPTWLEGERLDYVLCHERCHIRRGDHWAKALGCVLLALHWFNPAVWLALWAAQRDMELSCDEMALRRLGEACRKEYSRTLLALSAPRRDFGPVLAFGTPAVKQRIVHALNFRRAGRATIAVALAVLLLAGLTCCTDARSAGVGAAERLYDRRTEYVGDASAVAALLNTVLEECEYQAYTIQLSTDAEPYGLSVRFEVPDGWAPDEEERSSLERETFRTGVLMLALVDNLSQCSQSFGPSELSDGDACFSASCTVEEAEALLGLEDLKACGQSVQGVEALLELIDARSGNS